MAFDFLPISGIIMAKRKRKGGDMTRRNQFLVLLFAVLAAFLIGQSFSAKSVARADDENDANWTCADWNKSSDAEKAVWVHGFLSGLYEVKAELAEAKECKNECLVDFENDMNALAKVKNDIKWLAESMEDGCADKKLKDTFLGDVAYGAIRLLEK